MPILNDKGNERAARRGVERTAQKRHDSKFTLNGRMISAVNPVTWLVRQGSLGYLAQPPLRCAPRRLHYSGNRCKSGTVAESGRKRLRSHGRSTHGTREHSLDLRNTSSLRMRRRSVAEPLSR
ncbi:hypothetical protein J6590_013313 [Homalodisca vitripennis]|nr:hypothetical protein J6590_013313 [Homalodisca vitripennis]